MLRFMESAGSDTAQGSLMVENPAVRLLEAAGPMLATVAATPLCTADDVCIDALCQVQAQELRVWIWSFRAKIIFVLFVISNRPLQCQKPQGISSCWVAWLLLLTGVMSQTQVHLGSYLACFYGC